MIEVPEISAQLCSVGEVQGWVVQIGPKHDWAGAWYSNNARGMQDACNFMGTLWMKFNGVPQLSDMSVGFKVVNQDDLFK